MMLPQFDHIASTAEFLYDVKLRLVLQGLMKTVQNEDATLFPWLRLRSRS